MPACLYREIIKNSVGWGETCYRHNFLWGRCVVQMGPISALESWCRLVGVQCPVATSRLAGWGGSRTTPWRADLPPKQSHQAGPLWLLLGGALSMCPNLSFSSQLNVGPTPILHSQKPHFPRLFRMCFNSVKMLLSVTPLYHTENILESVQNWQENKDYRTFLIFNKSCYTIGSSPADFRFLNLQCNNIQ